MNLIEAIERTKWDILATFLEFGFSPRRLLSEFTEEELYHLYRVKRGGRGGRLDPAGRSAKRRAPTRQGPSRRRRVHRKFPHDVQYLTAGQAADLVLLSSQLLAAKRRRGEELSLRERIWLWDEERMRACLGSDIVAKRCSMDDYLWEIFRSYRSMGIELTLNACRHIYETKLLVASLYRSAVSQESRGNITYFAPPIGQGGGQERMREFNAAFERLRERIERQAKKDR